MKQLFSTVVLLLFILNTSFSQKGKVKFGKIDKAELSYNTSLGFQYTFKRHFRIKILDKSQLDLADFSIPIYNDVDSRERLTKFNGITHTLKNGKVVETAVNKGDLFKEEISKRKTRMTIAMPNVQEGSIIEIKYSVTSPFYWNLQDWQYQYEIPVKYSEYRISYPEWFDYTTSFKGYDLAYITPLELQPNMQSITFNSVKRSGEYVVQSKFSSSKVDYERRNYGWIAENMPAFVEEDYISSLNNYLVKVSFELSSTNFPNNGWKSYVTTWDALGKTMLESNNFGKQLSKSRTKFLANEVKGIMASKNTPAEQVASIYYYLKSKVAWNGDNGLFTTDNLKNAYEKGKGNVAEVNLLLIAMLRQAGFTVDPVLLSTKHHGFLNAAFPALAQFNYVIAKVNLPDGKAVLLDATPRLLPIDLLPTRCLNEKGLIVNETGVSWANLQPKGKYKVSSSIILNLTEDMAWDGIMKTRCSDYAASAMRATYDSKENEATYISNIESAHEGILEKRNYPVDFHIPQNEVYSIQYIIPDGYTVEELPKTKQIALPEKGGSFSYSIKVQGGKIMVLSQFKILKHQFLPEEYQALKEFYNIIIDKHAEQIVLKKA